MKLIKETNRIVGTIRGYDGVCDGCGTPLTYDDELIVIEILNMPDKVLLVPVDRIICPHCNLELSIIKMWKSLEVSEELKK